MPLITANKVTLKDVAAKAGVSTATASTALASRPEGNTRVSKEVARRVLKTAREMRYRPNLYARRLSKTNTRTIALIVKSNLWHNFLWSVSAAQKTLHEHHCEEIFHMNDNCLKQEARQLEMCLEARVDGILLFPLVDLEGRTNAKVVNKIMAVEKVPIVLMDNALPGCHAPSVTADETAGAARAVHELHQLGHRRIAHLTLGGYQNAEPTNPLLHAHRRYRGYQQAMDELGLEAHVLSVNAYQETGRVFDDMVSLSRKLGGSVDRPTATLVYSDSLAAAAMAGFHDAGLDVPGDVSIIGIDRSQLTDVVRPRLGMMSLPHPQLGIRGTDTLLRCIEGEAAQNLRIPLNYEPGQTVATPGD